MKTKYTTIISFALLGLLFLLPAIGHAQPGFGDDVDDVPIDGGLSLLLAAGIGYGARKLARHKKPVRVKAFRK